MVETEEGLSAYEQISEYNACLNNILYWFANHVKILDRTQKKIVPYEMWPHLVEFIRDSYRYHENITLKSKQVGVSWALAGINLFDCYTPGANELELSKGKDEAAELLWKSHFIWEHLPPYLQLEKDHDGTFLFSFKNASRIMTFASTPDAGIGETASRATLDEHEFHEYARENYGHIRATVDAGAFLNVVSTSDPTRVDSNFKTLWRDARAGKNNLHPTFLHA